MLKHFKVLALKSFSISGTAVNRADTAPFAVFGENNTNLVKWCKFTVVLLPSCWLLLVLVQAAWGSRRWGRSSCTGSPSWVWRTSSTSFTLPKSAWIRVISRIRWRRPTFCRSCLFWSSAMSCWAVRWGCFFLSLMACHRPILRYLIIEGGHGSPLAAVRVLLIRLWISLGCLTVLTHPCPQR